MKARINPKRLTELTSSLVKYPTVNPPAELGPACAFVRDWLAKEGVSSRLYEPVKGKVSLVASIGPMKPGLIFNGHLDVVPAGDPKGWKLDPFSGIVRGGIVYGRGSSDMKGGCAAIIETLVALSRVEASLERRITLSLVPDEETGGKDGTKYLVENKLIEGEFAVVAEPTSMDCCFVGEKGLIRFLLKAKGKPAHSSLSGYVGENAITKATSAIDPILEFQGREYSPPKSAGSIVRDSAEVLVETTGKKEAKGLAREITVNVGVISGGTKSNVIPDAAEMEVDMRIPLGAKVSAIKSEIRKTLAGKGLEFVLVRENDPNYSDPSNPFVREFCRIASQVIGRRVRPALLWSSTDAKHLRRANVPTLIYGPGTWSKLHAYNEYVSMKEVRLCAETYLTFGLTPP